MSRAFKNRQQAGEELGLFLKPKYMHQNPLVLGIPRGGVEVAYYVSKQLDAELSLAVAKKLPFPGQEEYGIGAIAEDHIVYVSPHGENALAPGVIENIIEKQAIEINRRVQKYRHGKALPDLKGRTVILVDDGIATGVTLVPVVRLCRKREAALIVIAVPVSGLQFDAHLQEADKIEVLVQPRDFYAVGQAYETFGDFPDEALMDLLKKAEQEHQHH
ncbi:phosphoribosyltransferase [Mucilaginibacter sp.]|jgi:predicted phosphoribosyltransferase|uniref:phosphoribosyltransferase n=1 Tax=Mucilaginibacter sp. TaxID=1882438 RepID=UPI003563891A